MGIQAVKGVEIGDGFALADERGSAAHDEIVRDERGLRRTTNRAGGIEGGVSNGEEIVVRAAMKPLPTLMRPLRSVDLATGEPAEAHVERSDVAAVEALAVVVEAVVAFELARAVREKLGGDARPPAFPEPDGRVKTSAAWLVERAGFARGYGSPGPIALSGKHTLAITNRGGGTALQLLELAREIAAGVEREFGIALVPEPVLVGHAWAEAAAQEQRAV